MTWGMGGSCEPKWLRDIAKGLRVRAASSDQSGRDKSMRCTRCCPPHQSPWLSVLAVPAIEDVMAACKALKHRCQTRGPRLCEGEAEGVYILALLPIVGTQLFIRGACQEQSNTIHHSAPIFRTFGKCGGLRCQYLQLARIRKTAGNRSIFAHHTPSCLPWKIVRQP